MTALLARSLFGRGVVAAWLIALAPVAVAKVPTRFYSHSHMLPGWRALQRSRARGSSWDAWPRVACTSPACRRDVPAAGWLCAEFSEEASLTWLLLVTTALIAEHMPPRGFVHRVELRALRGDSSSDSGDHTRRCQ